MAVPGGRFSRSPPASIQSANAQRIGKPPPDAPKSFKDRWSALRSLETSLRRHIGKPPPPPVQAVPTSEHTRVTVPFASATHQAEVTSLPAGRTSPQELAVLVPGTGTARVHKDLVRKCPATSPQSTAESSPKKGDPYCGSGASSSRKGTLTTREAKLVLIFHMSSAGASTIQQEQLKRFADATGFDGTDEDWAEDYVLVCRDSGIDPESGLGVGAFIQVVNNMEPYVDDAHLTRIWCAEKRSRKPAQHDVPPADPSASSSSDPLSTIAPGAGPPGGQTSSSPVTVVPIGPPSKPPRTLQEAPSTGGGPGNNNCTNAVAKAAAPRKRPDTLPAFTPSLDLILEGLGTTYHAVGVTDDDSDEPVQGGAHGEGDGSSTPEWKQHIFGNLGSRLRPKAAPSGIPKAAPESLPTPQPPPEQF